VANKAVWVLAVITALMTAFYMFRLMAMTFLGAYRGPAWETHGGGQGAAHAHDTGHDAHGDHGAHGHAHDDDGGGHGHGAWHGPHESPRAMTFPLNVLAIGALIAGFVGVPPALLGGNAIEHFLEPSFTAEARAGAEAPTGIAQGSPAGAAEQAGLKSGATSENEGEPHVSRGVELGLMGFSVLVALLGISAAWKFYVTSPEISDRLAGQFAGAHRVLSNKYYVDELYDATVISGTMASGRGLWAVDRGVVDGAVNGTGRATIVGSWFSGLTDRTVVDGLVNLVGWVVQESSHVFRRLQTGLVQNYALLMLFGVFVFVSLYLFVR
jgi:NADH-quinone oxidoreductase subunit L